MKNIVLCSDGTGNRDIKNRGTNVFKLYEAVDIQGHKAGDQITKQVAFYDDGVGTANAFAKVVGGAFGWGFSRNVKKLYRELVNVYEGGDKIFLFGFSRGAYTVRALAGFIQHCGVLDSDYYQKLPRAALTRKIADSWEEFKSVAFQYVKGEERRSRIPSEAEVAQEQQAKIARRQANHAVKPEDPVDIAFIGVWDTVGAIGTPFDGMRDFINRFHPIWFSDNTLGPEVGRARHALALDEERRTFQPELWNEQDGRDKRIKQVWFSGVHSNVGGGYPKQGMSLVTLDWMMNEAKDAGLRFVQEDLDFVQEHQDVHDKLYDSRSGINVYYRWSPRDVNLLCREHRVPVPRFHVSVFERIANGTNGMNGGDAYSPGNIPFAMEVDSSGSIGMWPPNPAAPARVPVLMRGYKNPQTGESLLADMKGEVCSGKQSYYAFLGLTALGLTLAGTLACSCRNHPERRGRRERQIGRVLPAAFGGGALLGLAAVGIHHWAHQVDCALCNKYTEYWHKCRRDLRKLLVP